MCRKLVFPERHIGAVSLPSGCQASFPKVNCHTAIAVKIAEAAPWRHSSDEAALWRLHTLRLAVAKRQLNCRHNNCRMTAARLQHGNCRKIRCRMLSAKPCRDGTVAALR
jgi:hypothetical protein